VYDVPDEDGHLQKRVWELKDFDPPYKIKDFTPPYKYIKTPHHHI
jgi:hypothetical protein